MSIRRNLRPGDTVIMGNDGLFIARNPEPKESFPTGFGDERYYHDADGFLRHIPERTRWTNPYSYDPIELINTGETATGSAYSDRMITWNYDKFYAEMEKLNAGRGELSFSWGDAELVEKLCKAYFDDETLKITRVVEMCNVSNGYPVWFICWNSSKQKENDV